MKPVILPLSTWHTPATDYPVYRGIANAGALASPFFRIHRHNYPVGMYHNWGVDGIDYFSAEKPLPVTSLQEFRGGKWCDWMVDDPPHWWAMQRYANEAAGRVLVGGLGLGLFLHAIAPRVQNGPVSSIIVVERDSNVIALVAPLLPPSLAVTFVQADFYDVFRTLEYDFALVDLWVTSNGTEKHNAFVKEVLPLYVNMRVLQPSAKMVFHGFVTVSDVALWPEGFNPHVLEGK